MSSFKKTLKILRREHRERSQPAAREHLGLLEKHKDYKRRAVDHQQKERQLKQLRRRALDKNPDEFYFKMCNSQLVNGAHVEQLKAPTYTNEQRKLLQTQDARYLRFKLQSELNKIERLKGELQEVSGAKPKHTRFRKTSESDKELMELTTKRKRKSEDKEDDETEAECDLEATLKSETAKKRAFLQKRVERSRQLRIALDKLETLQNVSETSIASRRGRVRGRQYEVRQLVAPETKQSAAVYKWMFTRKR